MGHMEGCKKNSNIGLYTSLGDTLTSKTGQMCKLLRVEADPGGHGPPNGSIFYSKQ